MHVLIGLVLAFVLIAVFSNRRTRLCRWRQDRANAPEGGMAWSCAACGARTVTKGKPPKDCLRPRG